MNLTGKKAVRPCRLLFLILCIVLAGCAARKTPQTELIKQANQYRQMLDQQRATATEAALGKIPPLNAEGHETLGDQYALQAKTDRTYKHYQEALRLEPGLIRVRYKIGRLYLEKGLWEEAEKAFGGIVERHPDYAPAYEGLGRALFGRNKLSEAQVHFDQAIRLDPGLWQTHNLLGIIHDRRKEFEKASSHYRRAIALHPEGGILYNNLGLSFFLNGEYAAALQALTTAARLAPDNKRIHNNLALVLCHQGRFQEAFDRFKSAGNEASAYYNLGSFYHTEKRYNEAVLSYQRAISAKPEFYVDAYEQMKKAKAALAPPP